MRVAMERFRELVAQAIDHLPEEFARRLDNVDVVVEDLPDPETQAQFPGPLLGLYHGVPLTDRSTMAMHFPDIIYIYKRNIERMCRTEGQIRAEVRATLLHEIGHHFGLDEEELKDV